MNGGAGPGQRWDVSTEAGVLACYDANFRPLYRSARHLCGDADAAEDLTQETFVRLVRAARNGQVDEVGFGWLVTTARRLFVDRLRHDGREQARLHLVASNPDPGPAEPSEVVDGIEGAAMLEPLGPRERAALVFRYVDDLPVADVAELLGTSVRATESLLQRAKHKAKGGASA